MQWLKSMFTELDNATWCPVRLFGIVFAIASSSVFLGLACWTVIRGHHRLDYMAFGSGLATVWATVSASIVFKAKFGDRR